MHNALKGLTAAAPLYIDNRGVGIRMITSGCPTFAHAIFDDWEVWEGFRTEPQLRLRVYNNGHH